MPSPSLRSRSSRRQRRQVVRSGTVVLVPVVDLLLWVRRRDPNNPGASRRVPGSRVSTPVPVAGLETGVTELDPLDRPRNRHVLLLLPLLRHLVLRHLRHPPLLLKLRQAAGHEEKECLGIDGVVTLPQTGQLQRRTIPGDGGFCSCRVMCGSCSVSPAVQNPQGLLAALRSCQGHRDAQLLVPPGTSSLRSRRLQAALPRSRSLMATARVLHRSSNVTTMVCVMRSRQAQELREQDRVLRRGNHGSRKELCATQRRQSHYHAASLPVTLDWNKTPDQRKRPAPTVKRLSSVTQSSAL